MALSSSRIQLSEVPQELVAWTAKIDKTQYTHALRYIPLSPPHNKDGCVGALDDRGVFMGAGSFEKSDGRKRRSAGCRARRSEIVVVVVVALTKSENVGGGGGGEAFVVDAIGFLTLTPLLLEEQRQRRRHRLHCGHGGGGGGGSG